jgi:hypothetical protein
MVVLLTAVMIPHLHVSIKGYVIGGQHIRDQEDLVLQLADSSVRSDTLTVAIAIDSRRAQTGICSGVVVTSRTSHECSPDDDVLTD